VSNVPDGGGSSRSNDEVLRSDEVLRIASCGLVLVEDLGRPDAVGWGVPSSGAADRAALRRANRLVGNPEECAALEVIGGLSATAMADAVIAVTGADVEVRVGGRAASTECGVDVVAGDSVVVGVARRGLRAYVAVRGGVGAPTTLGSRSRDVLSGIGPMPLTAGDAVCTTGISPASGPWRERLPVAGARATALRITPGPHLSWIDPEALVRTAWTVSATSNRVGLRLEGAPLQRPAGEIEPVPVLPGAIQLPPDGRPIVLGPDAGVTGGYPVIACIADDLDALGQLAPGDPLTLRWS